MARIWLACAALLGLAFVALLALSAHGPQLLAAVFDIRVSPAPLVADGKAGVAAAAAAAAAPAAGGGGPIRLTSVEQALVLHGFHALALGLVALWIALRGGVFANLAALGFLTGTLLFAGPIYLRAIGEPVDSSLTPLGGSILLGAWAVFALAALFGGSSAGAPAAARAVARPTSRPAASLSTGWATTAPAARSVPVAGPQPQPQQTRQVAVETRRQPSTANRAPVSGPPKRPAVSR
jgi:uncharacterized membrane protein YgdD (TMEM256/DUF423 family)